MKNDRHDIIIYNDEVDPGDDLAARRIRHVEVLYRPVLEPGTLDVIDWM